MGGMEGFGLGMEMEHRLRGEEGVERHIFGHSRETGEYSQQRNRRRRQLRIFRSCPLILSLVTSENV